jgi:predicted AAA+ superfamily ATPase
VRWKEPKNSVFGALEGTKKGNCGIIVDMQAEKKQLLMAYLQNQIAQLDDKVKNFTADPLKECYPHRDVFAKFERYLQEFTEGNLSYRWLIVSGLRGVGKTTLMYQLIEQLSVEKLHKVYICVDEVTRQLGVCLRDILEVYEELLGQTFESLQTPIYIFLDEVQYDREWAITLKTLYDRAPRVLVMATGSAAVTLQTNADVNRRALMEKIFPLSFSEYIRLKFGRQKTVDLAEKIRLALFRASSAKDSYIRLRAVEQEIQQYYVGIGRLEVENYLQVGTMPFMLRLNNVGVAYDQMKKTVGTILTQDIPQLGKFNSEILDVFPRLLYILTNNVITASDKLANNLGVGKKTVLSMLDVLEQTELVLRVYPYSFRAGQIRKSSKYLFATPVIRSMYLNFLGSILAPGDIKGMVFEDTVAMYLNRYLLRHSVDFSLTYDSAKGGADFILGLRESGRLVVVEAGMGKKSFKQLETTRKRLGESFVYGLNVSESPLVLDKSERFVNVPLKYFLLL